MTEIPNNDDRLFDLISWSAGLQAVTLTIIDLVLFIKCKKIHIKVCRQTLRAIPALTLTKIYDKLLKFEVIGIDEGQFVSALHIM